MKVDSPAISWHGPKDRILSIDFHPFQNEFASAGSDERKFIEQQVQGTQGCIKVWQLKKNKNGDSIDVKIMYGLSQANRNVNCVKYSPNGAMLASGSDDKSITIWAKRMKPKSISSIEQVCRWTPRDRLMGSDGDVIDLKWTKDSRLLISSGMDSRIFIWSIEKKYHIKVIDEHHKFVQGIAIDPQFQNFISCGSDRTTRVWRKTKSKKNQAVFYCLKNINRYKNGVKQQENTDENKGGFRIFADQNLPSFFRRPDISPDGLLYLLPAGLWPKNKQQTQGQNCAFLYRRNFLDKPSFVIPTKGQPALACRFCPNLFKKENPKQGIFKQDYYMVFAIGTSSSVLVYSTMSMGLLYGIGNYHYAAITQLTWKNSQMIAVSSSDGYCSFMLFEEGELGKPYEATGQLAELLKIEQYIPQTNINKEEVVHEAQKIIINKNQRGETRKTVIPQMIQKL